MRWLAALAIAAISLTACATARSEPRIVTVRSLVVEYGREFQVCAVEELASSPNVRQLPRC